MANSVIYQTLNVPDASTEGTTQGTYKCIAVLTTDASGEFSSQRLNTTSGDMGTNNKVLCIKGHLPGYSGILKFDASSPVPFMTVPKDKDFHFHFHSPIPNPQGAGNTGDITLDTNGAASVTGKGFIELVVFRNA